VFQITIFLLYCSAGLLFALTRLPRFAPQRVMYLLAAFSLTITGALWHGFLLAGAILMNSTLAISSSSMMSFIGLELAITAIIAAISHALRGVSAGLLILAAVIVLTAGVGTSVASLDTGIATTNWQIKSHVLISLLAYGLLTVGAIVALFALVQERRLHAGQLSTMNSLFAPLETTEKLLFAIATAGFLSLLVAVMSGFAFVDNLFEQHLIHKTVLSLLALLLFGVLLARRLFSGTRGKRAVYLYLWGFAILCLAYFGSRFVLEEILGRSWS